MSVDGKDRRNRLMTLTSAGRVLLASAVPVWEQTHEEIDRLITGSDPDTLRATTADELVPFGHELLYLPKVDLFGRGQFVPLPVQRYGHCNFTTNELLGSFALAVSLP